MIKKLHILKTLRIFGGAERLIADLCSHDKNCHVLVFDGKQPYDIYKFKKGQISIVSNIFKAFLWTLKNGKKFDIYHLHLFPCTYLALLLPRRKTVIHEHNTTNRRRNYFVFRLIESFLFHRANFISISKGADRELRRWIIGTVNSRVIYNFSSIPVLKINTPGFNNQIPFAIMVASFTKQKDQLRLLKILAKIKIQNFQFIFLGEGPQLADCKAFTETEPHLRNTIKFVGNQDPRVYYKHCVYNVLFSKWEGFGLTIVEAARYNKQTITLKCPGLEEVANPDLTILPCQSDEEVGIIFKNLHKLLIANQIPSKWTNYLAEKYSVKNYIEEYENFLLTILREGD